MLARSVVTTNKRPVVHSRAIVMLIVTIGFFMNFDLSGIE
jgi:hypothetical protein